LFCQQGGQKAIKRLNSYLFQLKLPIALLSAVLSAILLPARLAVQVYSTNQVYSKNFKIFLLGGVTF
jgi:hypothetical protein